MPHGNNSHLKSETQQALSKAKADHMTSLSLCLPHTIHLPPPGWEVSCVGVSLYIYIQHLLSGAATLCICQLVKSLVKDPRTALSLRPPIKHCDWLPERPWMSSNPTETLSFCLLILTQCPNICRRHISLRVRKLFEQKCYHMKQDAYL